MMRARRQTAPHLVALVEGIAEACIDNPHDAPLDLLGERISLTAGSVGPRDAERCLGGPGGRVRG